MTGLFAQTNLDRSVDFSIENATVAEALFKLADENDLSVTFSSSFFSNEKSINLTLENKPISSILQQILKGTDVAFKQKHQQFILYPKRLSGPKKFSINGYVQSEDSHEKLIGVNVYHKSSGSWTNTNEYGFYSLTLPQGEVELTFSYLGCSEKKEVLSLNQSIRKDISLKSEMTLAEVLITPNDHLENSTFTTTGEGQLMPPNYLSISPNIGGESDVVALAKSLPGVQSGADGFGGLYVRGGDAGQNLMLLDGVPIYNPSHLLGIFSVYNSDAIRSARLLKGQFPARYGGRVSSVFDVRSKEGNQKEWRGVAGIGLISGQASVEGPILNKKGGIIISGRRTHSNVLMDRVFKNTLLGESDDYEFNFFDINAKVHYALSEKDRLFLSYYKGKDNFEGNYSEEDGELEESNENLLNWGNEIGALRWNKIWGSRLFSNTTLTYSSYKYQNAFLFSIDWEDENDEELEDFYTFEDIRTEIRDWAFKSDFDFIPNPKHSIKFGLSHIRHQFVPYASQYESEESPDSIVIDSIDFGDFTELYEEQSLLGTEWAGYVEDEYNLSAKVKINGGLRLSAFDQEGDFFMNLEPRLKLAIRPNDKFMITAGASKMVQYLQQVALSGLSMPGDIWLPATKEYQPVESWMGELGTQVKLNKQLIFSTDVYLKKMKNLIAVDSQLEIDLDDQGEPVIDGLITGEGSGYGLEMLLEKKGKTGGWLSYTLAKANRQFEDANGGKRFAFDFDRRQAINAFIYHRINDKWSASLNWVYGTGSPEIRFVSQSDQLAFDEDETLFEWSDQKNKKRNKAYHRLDVSVTYEFATNNLDHTLKFGAYNVYNRANTAFHRIHTESSDQDFLTSPVTLLYFTPSVYYQVRF